MDRENLSRYSRRDFLRNTALLTGGAVFFQEELLVPFLKSGELPFKTREQGVVDFKANHRPIVIDRGDAVSPLDKIRNTPLAESLVKAANIHFWGYEIPERIGTSFSINPDQFVLANNSYRFLSLTNSASPDKLFRPLRGGETYPGMMEQIFDTGVWLTSRGSQGERVNSAVVIEVNEQLPSDKLCEVSGLLYDHGFETLVLGNEIDLPWDYNWKNKPNLLRYTLGEVRNCFIRRGIRDSRRGPAAPAYYGHPIFRQEPELQAISSSDFQFITVNYYGPVNDDENGREEKHERRFIPGVRTTLDYASQVLQRNGWTDKKVIIREIGFPGADHPKTQFTQKQLAECHIPATLTLAATADYVSDIFWYNFYSPGQDYQSLASFIDGRWVLKPTFYAWLNLAQEVGFKRKAEILADNREYTLVRILRSDNVSLIRGWANGTREVVFEIPEDDDVVIVDAYGNVVHDKYLIFRPSPAPPILTGPSMAMVKEGHLDPPKRVR